jgi:HK97 family phage portal protein
MAHYELIRPRRSGMLQRWADGLRSIYLGPWNPRDKEIARWFGGAASHSGVAVNEHTALNYSAVWAAVNLIAGDISSVPLNLYRMDKDGGKSKFDNHPLYRLIHDQPNPQMNSDIFRRTLQAHKLIWGNGYAEIVRNGEGRPVELWPLLPWAVSPYLHGGELYYRVGQGGEQVILNPMDILHLRGLSDDGVNGLPVITKARESVGLGLAAERFGATFFGNGSSFGGIISYPPGIASNPQTRKENRDNIEKVHQGPDRAHRFLALYEGAKYERLGIPPNDAQFLETRQFQIAEVARWFGVPPHKIGDLEHATFSNIEQQSIEYVTGCLRPHFVHWEQELTRKLVSPIERSQQMIKHNMEGLLRGDAAARGAFYSQLFQIGAITQNEIRELEDLNPIPGGDTPFVPLNSIPSDRLTEYVDALIEAKNPPPPPAPVVAQPPPDPKAQEDLKAARKLAQEAEDARDVALAALEKADTAAGNVAMALRAEMESERERRVAAQEAITLNWEPKITALTVERDALAARCDLIEKDYQRVCGELSHEKTAHEATQANRDEGLRALKASLDMTEAGCAELRVKLAEAEQSRDAERTQVKAVTESHQALETETRAILTVMEGVKTDLRTITVERDGIAAEVETLKTDLARARSDIAAELEKQRTQKAVLLAAMRSLFVDASERLLFKETERARKHQATPEKLRDWIERFYPMHGEYARATFQPLVGPWTAITGGAPGVLLDKLVTEHIEASRSALALVADTDDPDALAANLERTIARWEHERADAMADALVREGMAS